MAIGITTFFAVIPQAYAVSNAAGTSHAVRNTTNNNADGGTDCTYSQCILMSSDGAANNDNHGVFMRNFGTCYSPGSGSNGGQYVEIDSAMTSTAISMLSFGTLNDSGLCSTPSTWHIFKTTQTTPHTIWAVKLDGSANIPATLDSSNFHQCDPTGNFNTTTGCTAATPPPAVNAPIDLHFSKQPETFATEIEIK